MAKTKTGGVQNSVQEAFSKNQSRPTSLTDLLSEELPDKTVEESTEQISEPSEQPTESNEPEQSTSGKGRTKPEKSKMKYPWQKFDSNSKTHIAGRQITSVDLNDYELAVLEFLASEDVRDTSVRKEARRLLRPAILKVAKSIEESGLPEW